MTLCKHIRIKSLGELLVCAIPCFEFLTAYVEKVVAYNISRLQIVGYEGYKAI
jgi:hypothetical protein